MTERKYRLSVLDQSPIRAGATPADAIRETLALAELCDRLGYHRYWLAEHHNTMGLAGTSPEVLIGQVAARTKRIRVGSGGVMLSHYSALKVAENFRMLETLFPGRIDLGIGRAPGSDQLTAMALTHGPGALPLEQFPTRIHDVLGFLRGSLPPNHPFARVHAMPAGDSVPEVWLLGTSFESASFAAYFGVPYSFAHFITAEGCKEALDHYRVNFRPSAWLKAPLASIGVFCLAADTPEEAERLTASRDLWILQLYKGERGTYPTPEQALSYPYTDRERAFIRYSRSRTVSGTPDAVRAKLIALADMLGISEFVIVTICHDFAARKRSYELIAEAFALQPAAPRP
jgi:luciferase family oxidoreductase group 1